MPSLLPTSFALGPQKAKEILSKNLESQDPAFAKPKQIEKQEQGIKVESCSTTENKGKKNTKGNV